jgi:hypothetical protein
MHTRSDTLIYLYGIAPGDAADPPSDLVGLEDGPVRLLRGAGVAAIVSDLPAPSYSDDALNARLEDLTWVGERGVAHERVLDWFAENGPVLPLSLFSLHRDEDRLRERLEEHGGRYSDLLGRLAGRREWGVKLWRREDAADHVERLSPALAALRKEMEDAPPGRRYLLEKKRDRLRADEIRLASQRLAHRVFGALGDVAEHATSTSLPSSQPEGTRVLLLSGAFLVPDAEFKAFHARVSEVAHEVGEVGFDVEFTGPWPPYHFANLDGS